MSCTCPAQQLPGNHQLLDLARTFVQSEKPHVAIEALDGVLLHVTRTAVDLHAAVGNAADHFRRKKLAARCLHRDRFACVALACRIECHAAGGIDLGLAVGQHRLHELELPDGLVELIDASERFDPTPLAAKLAENAVEGRHLRVYETSDPNLLLVKEKRGPRSLDDYAIERDEGLVADLKLFAQAL